MKKTIHTPQGDAVQRKLVELRSAAGLTHRDLAQKLKREHSFVWRIEHGERRLDLVEFFWVCEALGQDASQIYSDLVAEFKELALKKPVKKPS
jgi:transcriptional regulator with XRE-family HTH domain